MLRNSSDITTSTISFTDSSDDRHSVKNKKKFFSKNKVKPNSSYDADVSNLDCERELTPGSLEVWVDLPDEIKYDPSLAPFRHQYEQHHGKLESEEPEGDKSIFQKNIAELMPIAEIGKNHNEFNKEAVNGVVEALKDGEEKKIKSAKKKRLQRTFRLLKLVCLVAGWLLLTVSLLMNQETSDVVLHTAVQGGEVKEYQLQPTDDRVTLLVKLTGPFRQSSANRTEQTDQLTIWLARTFDTKESSYEQNSTSWTIDLQPPELIDFSPSATDTKTLVLDTARSIHYRQQLEKGAATSGFEAIEFSNRDLNHTSVALRMRTSGASVVPLTVSYQLSPLAESDGLVYSMILLLFLYILIIFEVINRTIAALLSSSLGVAVLALSGVRPSLPELMSWLDVETLLLLFSMMLLVAILADTGLFDYLAVLAFEVTGGRTWPLINCLCLFTAVCSTFLDNVTTVLLMTPVTIRLCEVMQLNPVPVLMCMVIFSNVGGAATPVGDPPNVIIASHPAVLSENINFTSFTLHMGVGILLVAVQTYFQLRFIFRDVNKLRHSVPVDIQEMRQEIAVWRRAAASLSSYSRDEDIVRKALEKKVEKLNIALLKKETGSGPSKSDPKFCSTLQQMKQKYRIRDKPLLVKSAICFTFVIAVFFLHAIPQLQSLSLGWTALLGALLLLLLAERDDLESVLARVEWSTLLFFAALFVLMEVSGLASAFVDNIPLTTMMVRVIAALADPNGLGLPLAPLAWALSFGACLGGNGTLIGASANVVCAGVAEQHGYRFTFLEYLKIGFPVMIGNLLVASVYLLVCHCAFTWH
ncbi:hypothetical protein JYU34_021971 [Plutella xylostella]|uniref:Citrate transporter-like domain-containing protein n=1 Tax=Plutella xylostella TaxID=51655 RepID=A0ABQ7PRR4_PLUXY|nr:hypothetical protein JYU34_021971 [Plutella xylostella]